MGIDVTIWGALLAGFVSFVSPCVLPLVPPYLGFLAGATIDQVTEDSDASRAIRRRMVFVAFCFVLGFTTVFVALGATASVVGQLLARYAQPLSIAAGAIILIMGLHFLGLFRIGLLYREARIDTGRVKAGPLGAYIIGLAFAFGWTPCIGPVLAAILFVAGSRDTVAEGAGLLAIYSLGMGIPFMLAALFAGAFLRLLKRFRAHLHTVERGMGGVLVLTGILFMTGQMQAMAFWLLETFPALARLG